MSPEGGAKKKVKRTKKHSSSSRHHSETKFVYNAVNKDGDEYNYIPYKQFLAIDKALEKIKKTAFNKSKIQKLPLGSPLLVCYKKDDGSASQYSIVFYVGYDKDSDTVYTCRVYPLMCMGIYYAVSPKDRANVGINATQYNKFYEDKCFILDTGSIV